MRIEEIEGNMSRDMLEANLRDRGQWLTTVSDEQILEECEKTGKELVAKDDCGSVCRCFNSWGHARRMPVPYLSGKTIRVAIEGMAT